MAFNPTKGPWKVVESSHKQGWSHWIETEKGTTVAAVSTLCTVPERDADTARLIAAAPELLEYLMGLVEAMKRGEIMTCDMCSKQTQETTAYLIGEAQALIAKVEGR